MIKVRSARAFVCALIVGVVSAFLAGCGTSPTSRFYTLQSLTFPAKGDARMLKEAKFAVALGPVEIPDYVDHAQIVTRTDQNQLRLAEFDLWGGSLKTDVNRVLVENLSALLMSDGVSVFSWRAYVPNTYKLLISIIRLDAVPGSKVSLKARWAVIGKDNMNLGALRDAVITRPVKSDQHSDVVSAMSDALEELSKEVAQDLKGCLVKETELAKK